MNIELYYFDGCPTYTQALDNLIAALTLERVTAEVEMIRVRGEADARAKEFPGSPTIRINGSDVDAASSHTRAVSYACRVYFEEGRKSGWPSVELIRQALQRERQTLSREAS